MTLTHLSDDQLLTSLDDLCLAGRRLDARLIVHLVEVEERRLHLKAACSSLFDFCVRRLHMSEGAAFRRITAARLARRFPSLVGYVGTGVVHLSTLVLLRDHLSDANIEELVATTSRKTKREVEALIARMAPRPDVPSTIRKLPSTAPANANANVAPTPTVTPSAPIAATAAGSLFGTEPPSSVASGAPASSVLRATARIEPLSESRYRVQLTVSSELREKLERAKDLMRHRNPSGDLAVVLERALDLLVAQLEKERLAKTSRPRRIAHTARAPETSRVTAAVRRGVFARDGEQCTYVDTQGRRCSSRTFLELDHIESRALGGPDDVANLRVACRAHNRLHAEEVFGRKCVERGIHFRQRKSAATCTAQVPRVPPNGGGHR